MRAATNWRVTVYPIEGGTRYGKDGFLSPDENTRHNAKELEKSIKRHCFDEIVGTGLDCDEVCSFCGNLWTEKSNDYNGGCCDTDEENKPSKEVSA